MKLYYHATSKQNYEKIKASGHIELGIDGIVYITEKPSDAVAFTFIRGTNPIYVLALFVDKPNEVTETFDHSEAFFQCKSYGYPHDIPMRNVVGCQKWSFKNNVPTVTNI